MRLRGAILCIVFGMIGAGGQSGAAATIQDPDRPVILGPDSRILGPRDSVRLARYDSGVDDPEPLFIVSVDGVERGFARDGDQCMDGKLGGEIVACEAEIAAAAHSAIPAPSYSFTPAGCDCTGGQSTIGSLSSSFPGYLSGGGSIVYLPGADDGTGETPAVPVPVVPVPATGILLLGALGFAAAVRRARS